jgi:hypothetical protein
LQAILLTHSYLFSIMKTNFTKSSARFGCYKEDNNKQNKFLPDEEFTIQDVLNADVSMPDKRWFIRYNCDLSVKEWREFALGCAKCVLPIYEAKYPDNKAARECIEATEQYLAGNLDPDTLYNKRRAAAADAAAAAAADAADAAYAAAYAADAAAADAAYAAAAAADAAYAADAAAAYAAAAYAAAAYAAAAADADAAYAADAAAADAAAADAAYAADAAADAADAAYAAAAAADAAYAAAYAADAAASKENLLQFMKDFFSK